MSTQKPGGPRVSISGCAEQPGHIQRPTRAQSVTRSMEDRVPPDYSSFGLKDQIAIVTGASQGIGRALAIGLATAGAHLVLAKHPTGRQDEIKEVQAEIESLGRQARVVLTDVSHVDEV